MRSKSRGERGGGRGSGPEPTLDPPLMLMIFTYDNSDVLSSHTVGNAYDTAQRKELGVIDNAPLSRFCRKKN